ncbi:MAG TPA: hypothetical protein VEA18_02625 [Candidatus Kapabacteria bacterium]|nr:hypothetical protein [Candidatus Kapabacteria bacterium]
MRQYVGIHEFFVEGGKEERSHALLHITEPSTPQEEKKGYFVALAEIEHGVTDQIEHLQRLIDDIETSYYEMDADNGKEPFEMTVEYMNRRGHHILAPKGSKVHCLVGIVRGNDILFAYHGSPEAYMFYQNANTVQHTTVIDGANDSSTQLFSAIMQGSMNPGDIFYIATPNVSKYMSADRLQKLLGMKQLDQLAPHIEKTLHDLEDDLSFAGMFVTLPKRYTHVAPPIQEEADEDSETSIQKLVQAEKTTDELLSPSLLGDTKKKLQSLFHEENESEEQPEPKETDTATAPEEETNHRTHTKTQKESLGSTVLVGLGRALVIGILGLFQVIKNTVIVLLRAVTGSFYFITNRHNKRRDVVAAWKRNVHTKKLYFRSLPLFSKILLIVTLTSALVFAGSVTYLKAREEKEKAVLVHEQTVASIIDRKAAADGSLIYGDEAKALRLLQEAQGLLATLPEDSDEARATKEGLHKDIETSLQKLRKMTVMAPETVIDLTTLRPEAKATRLALIDDTLIAYSDDDTFFYQVNRTTKKGEVKDHQAVHKLKAASTPKEQDKIVFVSGPTNIAEYVKDTGVIATRDIAFPNDGVSLVDHFVYNQRLYTLDQAKKHIYKHNRTQTGYDKGQVWNKNGQEVLGSARALSIDGDVYVLTDTSIVKFVSGYTEAFTITGLDPALKNPTTLWTYNDVNYLYVLEPDTKRIIVLQKDGKVVTQYTANEWTHPTGMVIDATKKTAYVLDEKKIYSIKID